MNFNWRQESASTAQLFGVSSNCRSALARDCVVSGNNDVASDDAFVNTATSTAVGLNAHDGVLPDITEA
jgi:hypothetical protein